MAFLDFFLLLAYALATFFSFAEEWYVGELVASLRWHWLIGGVVLAVWYGARRKYLLLAAALALTLYHTLTIGTLLLAPRPVLPEVKTYHTLRVFQHNTLRFKDNADAVIDWLKAHGQEYDVVFLQEVSPKLNGRINELLQEFPYIIPAYYEQRFDNAVLSKLPVSSFEIRMFPDLEIGYIRCLFSLDGEGNSVMMYGMHATAPVSPAYWLARNSQFGHIAEEIAQDEAPRKFLVGDLNLTPYSPIFGALLEISGLHNSMEGFGLENTWGSFLPARFLGLPIDHLLISDGMYVKDKHVGPSLGSDHYSVQTVLAITKRTNPDSR